MPLSRRTSRLVTVPALAALLVAAGASGTVAARKYVITSIDQIKPGVVKKLQGKAGADGARGPAGPAGPQGATGVQGPIGLPGTGTSSMVYGFKDAGTTITDTGSVVTGTLMASMTIPAVPTLVVGTLDLKMSRTTAGPVGATCAVITPGSGIDSHDAVFEVETGAETQTSLSFQVTSTGGTTVEVRCRKDAATSFAYADTVKVSAVRVDGITTNVLP